ncbi:unnamed protein product [Meganyctiphanes norvegica]|uniref:Transmembrane protein 65 n=1 Tax=Meganyctiphanes norvegica TaxID=48144 RepID=A0AAV2QX97_MEGNR
MAKLLWILKQPRSSLLLNKLHGEARQLSFCLVNYSSVSKDLNKGENDTQSIVGDDRTVRTNDSLSEEHHYFRPDSVKDFVATLKEEHRQAILGELQIIESNKIKKSAEDTLASWKWRSRFGRPSSLNSDPTGTYCEIPQAWIQKKIAESAKPQDPTFAQLRHVGFFNAIPFIGFGFLDNLVMILAGDYIDMTLGVSFGISTMTAAALGNTISDLMGIGSAWYVEWMAEKVGVIPPNLSPEQLDLGSARWAANLGRGFGVVLGCLLGMFPLLLISTKEEEGGTTKEEEQ